MDDRIAAARLHNHGIETPRASTPEQVVAWLGAVQAQDYRAALWAVGLRLPSATAAAVEPAVSDGRILRTHVLRPTWHFVTAADIHWMLELTAPHVQRRMATYYAQLGLDDAVRRRGAKIIERTLSAGEHCTRAELAAALARARLPLTGVRLAVLTLHAELEGIICSGAPRRHQATYALLDARVPRGPRLSRDEALAELTRRYFRSHAPATVRDFVWWSGLSTADARRGLEAAGAKHERIGEHAYWRLDGEAPAKAPAKATSKALTSRSRKTSGAVHLLPIYDEYLVAYRDLHAVPRPPSTWGVLPQAVVANGQVAGTWKVARQRDAVAIHVTHARRLGASEQRALAQAAARYGRFLGVPHTLQKVLRS